MGIVPNYGVKVAGYDSRRGCLLEIPPCKGTLMRYRTLREKSLLVEGPRLFNSLPGYLRDHAGTMENFKATLDTFLASVPEQPNGSELPGSINKDCMPSNSLRDWMRSLNLYNWAPMSNVTNIVTDADMNLLDATDLGQDII